MILPENGMHVNVSDLSILDQSGLPGMIFHYFLVTFMTIFEESERNNVSFWFPFCLFFPYWEICSVFLT